jgi:hypothetical protein
MQILSTSIYATLDKFRSPNFYWFHACEYGRVNDSLGGSEAVARLARDRCQEHHDGIKPIYLLSISPIFPLYPLAGKDESLSNIKQNLYRL